MHFGIDTSNNNAHPIDWAAAYAELKSLGGGAEPFVIHKVIQGTRFVDSTTAGDVAAARAAGFKFQAGYLMDQGNSSVAAEEDLYQRTSSLPQTDDIELPEGLSVAQYVAHAQDLVNIHPNELSYLNQSEEDEGFPEGAGIWEANYNKRPGVVHHANVVIHQYDDAGVIPGCAGVFDMNAWVGSEAAFALFFGAAPAVTPVELPATIARVPTTEEVPLTEAEFFVWVRGWWYLLRTDLPPAGEANLLWTLFNTPTTQQVMGVNGFGGSLDLVLANIHDTAGAHLK